MCVSDNNASKNKFGPYFQVWLLDILLISQSSQALCKDLNFCVQNK